MKELYHKTICLDFKDEKFYKSCMNSRNIFKNFIEKRYEEYPELFPKKMGENWQCCGFTNPSKKTD